RKKKPEPKKMLTAAAENYKPVKLKSKEAEETERDEGPRGWFLPVVESAYTRLGPGGTPPRAVPSGAAVPEPFASTLQPGAGEAVLAEVPITYWVDVLRQYKMRLAARAPTAVRTAMAAPIIPGAKNWLPLGPTVVTHGQTVGNEPIGGRVSGL